MIPIGRREHMQTVRTVPCRAAFGIIRNPLPSNVWQTGLMPSPKTFRLMENFNLTGPHKFRTMALCRQEHTSLKASPPTGEAIFLLRGESSLSAQPGSRMVTLGAFYFRHSLPLTLFTSLKTKPPSRGNLWHHRKKKTAIRRSPMNCYALTSNTYREMSGRPL